MPPPALKRRPALRPLPRQFYGRDAQAVARDLLGTVILRRRDGIEQLARIVETEAYLGPHDLAAHSARGRTARTEVMFGPPGHAYVYLIYGIHHCFNVVTGPAGEAAAVLIRAVEPLANVTERTSGPGLLCRALGIDRHLNGTDLLGNDIRIVAPARRARTTVVRRPRIGVDYAGRWARRLLRFYIRGNDWVSRP